MTRTVCLGSKVKVPVLFGAAGATGLGVNVKGGSGGSESGLSAW